MSNEGNNPLEITYGEQTFDFGQGGLPQATLVAMLRRGVAHYLGSEQASKVLNKIEKAICEGEDEADTKARTEKFEALTGGERRAAIGQFREANPDLIAKWNAEVQSDAVQAMTDGKVGVSVRGPSVDPLTTILNRLAKAEVVNVLRANKTAIPKKADAPVTFPNGDEFTVAQLVERRKGHADHGPRLLKEAKKVLADQERSAKKAAEAGLSDL